MASSLVFGVSPSVLPSSSSLAKEVKNLTLSIAQNKKSTPAVGPLGGDISKGFISSKSTGGGSSSKPPQNVQTQQAQPAAVATPSFFSLAGQAAAFQRVVDTPRLIWERATGQAVGYKMDAATNFFTHPAFIFGSPAAVAAAPLVFGGASAAAASAGTVGGFSIPSAAKIAGISALAAGGAGYLLGGMGKSPTATTAPQSLPQSGAIFSPMNTSIFAPYSDESTNTINNLFTQIISGSPNASISGEQTAIQPRTATQSIDPYISATPSQSLQGTQSQEAAATGGSDWGIIALIAGAAFILTQR